MNDTQNIRDQVDALLAAVKTLDEAQPPDPLGIAAAVRDLDGLRQSYAQNPAAFADRVDQLRQARASLDGLILRGQTAIAEAYVKAFEAVRENETLCNECRSLLIRLRETHGVNRWAVGHQDVSVQQHTMLGLPESGSPARVALEGYLEEHGRLRSLSVLHKSALVRALDGGAIPDEERKAIGQWCKVGMGSRVMIRARFEGRPLSDQPSAGSGNGG